MARPSSRTIASLTAVVLATSLLACSGAQSPTAPPEDVAAPNTLTNAERAAGWRLLFDGTTTAGWRGFQSTAMPAGWQAVDGALTRLGTAGDIVTIDRFGNFELTFEWQIAAGGNSGVMYRISESSPFTFFSGPELQIVDNAADGGDPLGRAGACYGMYAPSRDVTRPVESWNATRLIANGAHVEHWLNGVKVVEYDIGSADWTARLLAGPYKDVAGYGREAAGHLALQDHNSRVAYRSLKIRPL